jgi:LPS export ABC transporter protein LptC
MSPRRIARALLSVGALAVILLVGVAVWIVRHRTPAQIAQSAAGMVPGSFVHVHNFHWTQMKAGASQWVLTAADASYSADRTALMLTDANLAMNSSEGKRVVVTAPKAALVMDGNHVKRADLSGGTRIVYGDFIITTDAATFIPDEDRVTAAGWVSVEGEGLKVTGMGLSGNSKTRTFDLLGQVSTQVIPKHHSEKSSKS